MKWYSVDRFLPGKGEGYVIVRIENCDQCEFVYMAFYSQGKWEYWDEEYFPSGRLDDEGIKVTHWMPMPNFGDF